MNQKGVFNSQQHEEEVQKLLSGKFRQFKLVIVDVGTQGFPAGLGTNGLVEEEGNGLRVLPSTIISKGKPDTNEQFSVYSPQSHGDTQAVLYVKFNHADNPWLPLSLPSLTDTNPNTIGSYCLTYGRFWLWCQNASPGGKVYLLISRGVSLYGAGLGPVIIGGYNAPTWSQLK